MIRILCALSAVVLGATAVLAQSSAIKERKEIMEKVSNDNKVMTAMVKGEAPFDGAKAGALLAPLEGMMKKYLTLFPDDSKTGDKTRAKPEIWQKKADFETKGMEFIKAVNDAKAATGSLDAFKVAFANVSKACDNCHEPYRGPRVP
jgi:cytochrome c556